MAKAKKIEVKDLSTEEKIKAAAKKLFTKKGYAATRTRDIAEESGINLALLNYYFRSKKKLFELVMKENVYLFMGVIIENMNNNPRPFEEQLDFIVSHYIDMLLENPDLPFFVLNLLQSGKLTFEDKDDPLIRNIQQMRGSFLKNIQDAMKKGKIKNIHPLHIIANLMGLIIFPFIASSLLMARSGNISRREFEQLMTERKKLIPEWIKSIMNAK
ncbi:MAG TPA: TetR/AcrR family transcriptional regulator [Chitinophagaceae bacterium]|jgi:AcrR family transcriptional regulator|nr:TetR/AcrR family transcriptional regulator [Chitinophagaceae bacterium]